MKLTNTARAAYIPTSRHDRPRVGTAISIVRRYAVLDALVARINHGLTTVAQYLTDTLGTDSDFIRRYVGSFGKVAKATYTAEFGTEPQRNGIARVGTKLFPAFAYRADARPILDKAARTYARTAALLAA